MSDEPQHDVTDPDSPIYAGEFGPLSAMARLSPPPGVTDGRLVWVERYDRMVVTRTTWPDVPDVTQEISYPTAEQAAEQWATSCVFYIQTLNYTHADGRRISP